MRWRVFCFLALHLLVLEFCPTSSTTMPSIEVTYQDVPGGPFVTQTFHGQTTRSVEENLSKGKQVACITSRVLNEVQHPLARVSVKMKELLFFYQEMAINLKVKVPLLACIKRAAGATRNKSLKAMLEIMYNDVSEGGLEIVESMQRFPATFDELAQGLIEASSRGSGNPSEGFKRVFLITKRAHSIRSKLINMLWYPGGVTVASAGVTVMICRQFVPVIKDFYGSFGAKLPPVTLALVSNYEYARDHGIITAAGVVAAIYVLKKVPGWVMATPVLHRYVLRLPLAGSFLRLLMQANLARTYMQLSNAGVLLPAKLRLCRNLSRFFPYRAAISWGLVRALNGEGFYDALVPEEWIFDPRLIEGLRSGEESGSGGELMENLVEMKEEQLDAMVETLSSVGPILFTALAAIPVAFVLLAVFSALAGLSTAISGG